MKRQLANVPYWSVDKRIPVLAKGGGQKRMLESELSSSILVPSSNSRTFRKYYQSCIARQCTVTKGFTEYIYHVGNGKELQSIVNHGLIPGGASLRTGRQAVFFTVVNPIVNQDGLVKKPMRLVTSKNRAVQKYLETISGHSILVQFEVRSTKRTAIFSKKVKRSYPL